MALKYLCAVVCAASLMIPMTPGWAQSGEKTAEDPVVVRVNGAEIHRSDVIAAQHALPAQYRSIPLSAIYPALRELQEGGYITCEVASQGKRSRNVCTLTDAGREVLAVAAESWGRVMPHLQTVIDEAPRRRQPIEFVGTNIDSKESVR